MGYINDTDPNTSYGLMPGEARPVQYVGWGPDSTKHFFQEMSIAGNVSDVPYSYLNNGYSFSSQANPQGIAQMFFGAPQTQIATPFNFNIPESNSTGTAYSVVDSGDSLVNVAESGQTNPITYSVSLDNGALTTFVNTLINSNPATSNGWSTISGDSGSCTTALPEQSLSISTAGHGTTNQYLSVTASGSDNTSGVQIDFTRNLYESFSTDDGTCTPTAQNRTLEIAGTPDRITTVATGDKVTVNVDDSCFGFKTIKSDEAGQITAAIGNQSVKFTNITVEPVAKSALEITHTAGATNQVEFNVVPQGHVGFGAQLVRITDNNGGDPSTGSNTIGTYYKYTINAYAFDGEGTTGSSSDSFGITQQTGVTLLDYGRNFPANIVQGQILTGETVTLSYVPYPVGTVLLAQRIAANHYATGLVPIMRVTCPE